MCTRMTAGPIATADSALGATAPTARPSADAEKDSSVRIPKNLAKRAGLGLRPHKG